MVHLGQERHAAAAKFGVRGSCVVHFEHQDHVGPGAVGGRGHHDAWPVPGGVVLLSERDSSTGCGERRVGRVVVAGQHLKPELIAVEVQRRGEVRNAKYGACACHPEVCHGRGPLRGRDWLRCGGEIAAPASWKPRSLSAGSSAPSSVSCSRWVGTWTCAAVSAAAFSASPSRIAARIARCPLTDPSRLPLSAWFGSCYPPV